MAVLPIPGEMFWNDFAFDLTDYTVCRSQTTIGIFKGLQENGYVFFKPNTDIQVGDVVHSDKIDFTVKRIENETYNGKTELISIHY